MCVNILTLICNLCQTVDMDGMAPADQLGLLVKEAQAMLHLRMTEALRPLGLSVPQYACLNALHEQPGLTSSELARRAFVSRQSMNVLLQGLEQHGLVERSTEPGPRRERAAMPTEASGQLLIRAHRVVGEVTRVMTGGLSSDDVVQALAILRLCRDALLDSGSKIASDTVSGTD